MITLLYVTYGLIAFIILGSLYLCRLSCISVREMYKFRKDFP